MKLIGVIEPLPPAPEQPSPGPTHEIGASGATYATARDALDAEVPAGWRLVFVRAGGH
ncbi:hypothetical protein [Xylanimonas allomyrinae]|uniref:hypothetical protein n=1 Tax=Xylanimonas allomyrinae TaxID=2509459 RepID=UPI0013A66E4D|nr:hypothetical protein [Xylanimonas allomyrinae]